jgi:U3 small nucleolar RNA-associated protein 14
MLLFVFFFHFLFYLLRLDLTCDRCCCLCLMKNSKRSKKGSAKEKGPGESSTAILDVLRREDDAGDFGNRARYGRVDNYEYEMPDEFDDEEIESDEAFNGDDNVKFAHVFDKKSKGKLDEEEAERSGEMDEDEGEYEDMALQLSSEGDDDRDDGRDGMLRDLSSKLQKVPAAPGKLRGLNMAQESEFGLVVGESGNDQVRLADVADLVGSEKTRRALKRVSRTESTSVPLGTETGKRLERKEAYKKARKDLSRWSTQIEQNRNARQVVLGDVPDKSAIVTTKVLASSFEPTSGLEKNIDAIIRESGADESNIAQYEQLEMHKLTVEEVAARAAQLAKMRSLMFYQEIKDKRQSKIKSRKYRKILKKQKEKGKMSLDEMRAVDPEAAEEQAEKQARDRVLERVTLRHRNTSKWVKGALRSGAMRDPGTREAIQAQLQQHELLRRKMGIEDEDEDDEDFDSNDAEKGRRDEDADDEEEEEDLNNPAFDPEQETPLPEPSKDAPKLASGSNLLEELVMPQGHRVRASGFISAKSKNEKEMVHGDPIVVVVTMEEEKEDREGKISGLARMGEEIKRQLQAAPAVTINPPQSTSKFHLTGRVQQAKQHSADRAALVRLAFAEDDAAEAFAEEKKRLEEAPVKNEEADEGLDGWGSWTGEGVAAKKKRKKRQKVQRKKAVVGDQDHVYINPKTSEDQKHLKTPVIPFPFTSKEQLRKKKRKSLCLCLL